jgi:predicted O-methyltransferase YrrM
MGQCSNDINSSMSQLKEWINNNTWLSKMTDQAAWGLTDLITSLGPNTRGIEIGVSQGINSYMLLSACPNIEKIYGVDPYVAYDDWVGPIKQEILDESYEIFSENLKLMADKFELIKMDSVSAALKFQDNSYDFVFVDGDHSAKAVLSDLDNYVPKIRKGGIVGGHDIGLSGVNMAINAWCRRHGVNTNKVRLVENQAWYWIKE